MRDTDRYKDPDKRKKYKKLYYLKNKEKWKIYNRAYRSRNLEKERARNREKHYVSSYNMTLDQRDAEIKKQKGKCLICGKKPKKVLQVDHDHKTGEYRGMLCRDCNIGLGFVEKDGFLDKALDYIDAGIG